VVVVELMGRSCESSRDLVVVDACVCPRDLVYIVQP